MKKSSKIITTLAAAVLIASAAGIINHSFAASDSGQVKQEETQASTIPVEQDATYESVALPDSSELQAAPQADQSANTRVDLDSITETIGIPLNLADISKQELNSSSDLSSTTSSSLKITKLEQVQANKTSNGDQVLVIYQLSDGKHEVVMSQSSNILGNVDAAVKDTQSWYDPNDVKVQQINGHTAVIEDAPNRKQVHIITDSHFYTVASPGTLNLDYLIELAGTINVE
ncbi:hypothetical protein [Cohnella laeviribosi]|jgi:hypothetical protein|uniref:hypothetical protein n=1 Tax=Cohnella laeviribosi TaxID=380174 RepID=UPI003D25AEE4